MAFDIERQERGSGARGCRSYLSSFCSFIILTPFKVVGFAVSIAFLIFVIALFVVLVPLAAIFYSIIGSRGNSGSPAKGLREMYRKSRDTEKIMDRIKSGSLRVLGRASLAVLLVMVLSVSVATLKRASLLGSPLWKWSLLGVILTAGYFQVVLIIYILLYILLSVWKKETASYYLRGLGTSMNLVTYFGMLLVLWLTYFGTEDGLKQASTPHPEAFEYMTWTFVSLFVGSILWLFKALLLARWSAAAIYRRFEPRILVTSLKYFFIGLTAADFCEDRIIQELQVLHKHGVSVEPLTFPLKFSVTKQVMSMKLGLTYLDYISSLLTSLAQIVSPIQDRDDEDAILSEVANWFEGKIKTEEMNTTDRCEENGLLKLLRAETCTGSDPDPFAFLVELAGVLISSDEDDQDKEKKTEKMARVLYKIVREECLSDNFSFNDFTIWMVDAHKDCINMGRTLADAKSIVTRLDWFMSSVIIVIVVLFWLLITGVASTTVLATIAAPFLTLTFIFGDAAKTFFQGLVFCFASHPLDVGDRCILDQTELEVKSVNILTTTFIKIGTKDKRVYPNSVLATKSIVNLGWQPDPKDVVELTIDSSVDLESLEAKIIEFLKNEKTPYKEPYKLVIEEVGERTKVKIHFTHVLTVHDLTHSQCFVKKSGQQSDFLKKVIQDINESRIDPANVNGENKTLMSNPDPSTSAHSNMSEVVESRNS